MGSSFSIFRPGDIVTVIHDLDPRKKYASQGEHPNCCVTGDMLAFAGKQVVITDIVSYSNGYLRYHIAEDGGRWVWTDEMFEEYNCGPNWQEEIEPSSEEEFLSFLLSV